MSNKQSKMGNNFI